MRTALLTIFIFFHLNTLTAQTEASLNTPGPKTINQWLLDHQVPAMAIGTIENGKVNSLMAYGKIQGDRPATTQTIFDVASLTKTITTLLTLKLVDSHAWNLDEPLANYWVDPDVKHDTLSNKITTRHVLSHRTGFKNWRWMNADKKLAFDFEPGAKFQYSGEGFEYLRNALEKKFKVSFQTLVDSLIFKPNQMNHSQLVWNENIDAQKFAGTYGQSGNLYEYVRASRANAVL